jgi:O-antigen/teichoic acid export membrane protein
MLNNEPQVDMSLGDKAVKGGIWVLSLRIASRLLQFSRTIILARLLAPHDFGLFGITLLCLQTLDTFTQTGFRLALIQKKGDVKSYLNTAWTAGLLRGAIIALFLFFLAPLAASFFEAPQAEPIVKVIGLSILFRSLTNISAIYFEKKLEFHKYFIFQFSGTIADLVVAVSAALLFRSVWALILGRLAGNFVSFIVSYIIDSYRPKFFLNLQMLNELLSFGKWILGSTVLIFITLQGDDLIVGKLLGATALGFYQIGYKISNVIATEISNPIMTVTFPAYSHLQDDPARLREAYLKVLRFITFFSFPIAGLTFATAKNFTMTVLGNKWEPIIPLVMILVFLAISRSIRGTLGSLARGIGRPEIETKVTAFQVIILMSLIFPGVLLFGLTGVAVVMVIQNLITLPVALNMILPKIQLKLRVFLHEIVFQLIATVLAAGIVYLIQINLAFGVYTLFLEIISGILIYLGIIWILNKPTLTSLNYLKERIVK